MAEAEVGDEQRLADPTTNRLQERVAELLGHEAGLFLPSGTMCNEIAFRLHIRPGGEEIISTARPTRAWPRRAVPLRSRAPTSTWSTATRGMFTGEQLQAAIQPPDRYSYRSRLVSVEQTTNLGGGRVWPLETVREVLDVARANGLRAHMDGARLMNAVVASGVPAADFTGGFDTAWVDFTKGLGAPVGAVMVGSRELIEEAWRYKQMWGGAMRQSGIVAAAGLYALDHHVERLAEDHANARRLAEGLAEVPGVTIDPATVETNIVLFEHDGAPRVGEELREAGVQVSRMGPTLLRAVTHLDVTADGIEHALEIMRRVIAG